MINTNGGRFGGYGFYLLKGKPVFLWICRPETDALGGAQALSPASTRSRSTSSTRASGFATLAFNNMSGLGQPGTGELRSMASRERPEDGAHDPIILQFDETFDVGADTGTPVHRPGLPGAFEFTGKLRS